MSTKTPAMVLQELTTKLGAAPPVYNLIHTLQGTHENEFKYEVDVLGITAQAMARSKKESKQETARRALKNLAEKGVFEPKEERSIDIQTVVDDEEELRSVHNYKGELGDRCMLCNLPSASYVEISAVGPPHKREFTYECHLLSLKTRSVASTKKVAQQNSAKEMLKRIEHIVPQLVEDYENKRAKLCDEDMEAMAAFDELNIIKKYNLGIKICDYTLILIEAMHSKNLHYSDLSIYLVDPKTDANMGIIFEKLGLSHSYETVQSTPTYAIVLHVNADTPLSSIGVGSTIDIAKNNALLDMFDIVQMLLTYSK